MSTSQPHPPTARIATPADFRVDEQPLGSSGLLLTVAGELDVATVPEVRARLAGALAKGVHRVVIDLRELFFLDSVAVAALLHVRRQLGDDGRMAVVVDPGSYIRMVFEIAGLPQCLDVVETLDEAVASVG